MINLAVEIWGVVGCWGCSQLHVGPVSNVEVHGALGIGQFHQEVHVVVTAGVSGLVELSEAWVALVVSLVRDVVVVLGSQVAEFGVAVEPLFKSQAATTQIGNRNSGNKQEPKTKRRGNESRELNWEQEYSS